METKKKKTASRRAVRYPLVVLGVGVLIAVVGPKLTDTIDPYRFGNAVGRIICIAFVAALVIGCMSDRKRRKIEQRMRQASDQ
jgi:hypothetical protein